MSRDKKPWWNGLKDGLRRLGLLPPREVVKSNEGPVEVLRETYGPEPPPMESSDTSSFTNSQIQLALDPRVRRLLTRGILTGTRYMWNYRPAPRPKVKKVRGADPRPLTATQPPLLPTIEEDGSVDGGASIEPIDLYYDSEDEDDQMDKEFVTPLRGPQDAPQPSPSSKKKVREAALPPWMRSVSSLFNQPKSAPQESPRVPPSHKSRKSSMQSQKSTARRKSSLDLETRHRAGSMDSSVSSLGLDSVVHMASKGAPPLQPLMVSPRGPGPGESTPRRGSFHEMSSPRTMSNLETQRRRQELLSPRRRLSSIDDN